MKAMFFRAIGFFILFSLICGVVYTGLVTVAAQAFFPKQANGSMIEVDGRVYGSSLVGQAFSQDTHLWGRPTNLDVSTYQDENGKPLAYAAPSNLSPASEEYASLMAERVNAMRAAHPAQGDTPIPVELVTGSGSGLDPHISPAAAAYQVERLAKANNISVAAVQEIIEDCTSERSFGLFGERTVNVLKVNLTLDGLLS